MSDIEYYTPSEVFSEYGHFIRTVLVSLVGNSALCDDLYQEFFLVICKKPIKKSKKCIKNFLYRALYNDVVDVWRKESRTKSRMIRFLEIKRQESENSSIVEEMIDNELLNRVLLNMENVLHDRELNVFKLRYEEDLTHKEIAEQMGLSINSVYCYLSTGAERLRKYFQRDLKNEG